jgi:two-component system sensor kinase FixL
MLTNEPRDQERPIYHSIYQYRVVGIYDRPVNSRGLQISKCPFMDDKRFLTVDDTERKLEVERLRQQEEQSWRVLHSAPIGCAAVQPDGQILTVNATLSQMLGYSEVELIGMSFLYIAHSKDRKESQQILDALMNGEVERHQSTKRYIKKSGQVVNVSVHFDALCDQSGKPRMLIAQLEDLDRRRKAEEEVQQQWERMTQINRLSMLAETAERIAHEINQPLTAIATYAQASRRLLSNPTCDKNDLRDALDKIDQQALRAGEVIRQLRALKLVHEGD